MFKVSPRNAYQVTVTLDTRHRWYKMNRVTVRVWLAPIRAPWNTQTDARRDTERNRQTGRHAHTHTRTHVRTYARATHTHTQWGTPDTEIKSTSSGLQRTQSNLSFSQLNPEVDLSLSVSLSSHPLPRLCVYVKTNKQKTNNNKTNTEQTATAKTHSDFYILGESATLMFCDIRVPRHFFFTVKSDNAHIQSINLPSPAAPARTRTRRSNHWAIPAPLVTVVQYPEPEQG